jgi:hypothetical protein
MFEKIVSFIKSLYPLLVETRDINKAVTNNSDKFPAGYVVELSKPEKSELVENFHRFNKLKHSTVILRPSPTTEF